MSPPIYTPDGSEVSEIVLPDGSAASEVIGPDGNVVFEAGPDIPDREDLHLHYNLSNVTDAATISAEIGPDLSAVGSPTVQTNVRNGNNAVLYDGSSDGHGSVSLSSSQPQPNHLFVVFAAESTGQSAATVVGSDVNEDRHDFILGTGAGDPIGAYAGTNLGGGSQDLDWHVGEVLFDGTNSQVWIDGTSIATGDAGGQSRESIALGFLDGFGGHYHGYIGELLEYSTDKTFSQSDVRTYLADEWDITL